MVATSAVLIVSGLVCVVLAGLAVRYLIPREGRPTSAWTSTEARATTVVLVLMTLFVIGAGMVLKGALA